MKKIALIIIFLIFAATGCEQEYERAIYRPSEINTLAFLSENADLITAIEITDGVVRNESNKEAVLKTKSVKAIIKKVLKGNYANGTQIEISNSTLHNLPGDIESLVSLRNGEYIAFLAMDGSLFRPLTPYSLIEIYPKTKIGRPIWKQKKNSKYIDRQDTPKETIIQEILATLKGGRTKVEE